MCQKFKVNPEWLEACGLNPESPAFKVISVESMQHSSGTTASWVTVDCGTHQWLVDSRRGKFVRDKTVVLQWEMETEPTIELLHPEEYYEHQQWYQVNYCSVCGIDTGVGGPDCCDFCGEQDDYFYD